MVVLGVAMVVLGVAMVVLGMAWSYFEYLALVLPSYHGVKFFAHKTVMP